MLQTNTRLVEFTAVRLTVDTNLSLHHARWLRGAIARQVSRPEFHNHAGRGFVYQHPLIRYHTYDNQAVILGLAAGAFLLRHLPAIETLRLGPDVCHVVDRSMELTRLAVGPCEAPQIYGFQTPFLALNQENHVLWLRSNPFAQRTLLQRIVVGNILSLSKGIGLHVEEELHAEVDLSATEWYDLKPGVRLLGFRGFIQTNFLLPDGWGIGKSSARGFGTLRRREA